MPTSRARLSWLVLLGALAVCAVLLFGPWWMTWTGENPLQRPTEPDLAAVLRLSLPTLGLALVLVLTLAAARRVRRARRAVRVDPDAPD